DSVLAVIWTKRLDPAVRDAASRLVDAELEIVIKENESRAAAHREIWTEPATGMFRAHRERQKSGDPYPSWSHLLGMKHSLAELRDYDSMLGGRNVVGT